ncbi:MAG: glycogen debranching protein GlgX [Hydrogenophaga sp.]|uniref:glycogen debranching protein GlgX n=1 Tax=Hydrogenophaga sp. TaxID=1904254 RepID=UPI000CC9C2E2|nr:glycogen debranching protein GlgX [Hydrogenophaga sp.]MDZ4280876.1 glycogen debranching protein GlgX [Hydrogenophaga sp.]PKO76574.1 MAG: glycogen debranching enzyme GlgX [Betaproteobacteria bacterium HGW-Betaproteobacteria-15]
MNPAHLTPELGAHLHEQNGQSGVQFAVWAPQAEGLEVCLFDSATGPETQRIVLANVGNGIWQAFVPGLSAGQLYGLRAHGPWAPEAGHRFNPARLLLDPWALALVGGTERLALQAGHTVADPLKPDQSWAEHQPDPQDNAAAMPKCVVLDAQAELDAGHAIAPPPVIAGERVFIYEAHVKALTRLHPEVPEAQRGSYAALAHPAVSAHLQRLGITTVCLLPVHQHISERHLLARGLVNHWGYNTLNAFAPEPGYAAATGGTDPANPERAAAVRAEFRVMVDALHRAGIEVVLDVVFNHTAESDLDGPTLSWRGLSQNSWYAMGEHGVPHNFSGCGNSLNVSEPRVLQWVMDSLRWWVQAYGVDGFRFDLAVSLGRVAALGHAFHPHAPLLTAMQQDPVLRHVRLIAEPWDIGPSGYHCGGFAPGWLEWNDRFRDGVRAFWLGHHASLGELASCVCASSDTFHHQGRLPEVSINLLTTHDGFTLADLTAYSHKHNAANGEDNRDGHSHNLSANAGVEGPSDDALVQHRRGLWRRALLATLLCAQGTPQLLAGDELGHSQQGNNNSYCQDNPLTWLDWPQADRELTDFVAGLAALRRQHPGLRHARWFSGRLPAPGGSADITWLHGDGDAMHDHAWHTSPHCTLGAVITVGEAARPPAERLLLAWHAGRGHTTMALPPGNWSLRLDSARSFVALNEAAGEPVRGSLHCAEPRVCVLVQSLQGG